MGHKTTKNFDKRYGGRIAVAYREKPLEPEESQIRNSGLLKAFIQVLAGELGREPTLKEQLGISEISPSKAVKT